MVHVFRSNMNQKRRPQIQSTYPGNYGNYGEALASTNSNHDEKIEGNDILIQSMT